MPILNYYEFPLGATVRGNYKSCSRELDEWVHKSFKGLVY